MACILLITLQMRCNSLVQISIGQACVHLPVKLLKILQQSAKDMLPKSLYCDTIVYFLFLQQKVLCCHHGMR